MTPSLLLRSIINIQYVMIELIRVTRLNCYEFVLQRWYTKLNFCVGVPTHRMHITFSCTGDGNQRISASSCMNVRDHGACYVQPPTHRRLHRCMHCQESYDTSTAVCRASAEEGIATGELQQRKQCGTHRVMYVRSSSSVALRQRSRKITSATSRTEKRGM